MRRRRKIIIINNNNKENCTKKARMDFLECLYWAIAGIDSAIGKYQNLIDRAATNEHGETIRRACTQRLLILDSKKKMLQAYTDMLKGGIAIDQETAEAIH